MYNVYIAVLTMFFVCVVQTAQVYCLLYMINKVLPADVCTNPPFA